MDDPVTWLRARFDEDEARATAEARAKRQILVEHAVYNTGAGDCCEICAEVDEDGQAHGDWPCATLRLLIVPHAGHPGCRSEWLPE